MSPTLFSLCLDAIPYQPEIYGKVCADSQTVIKLIQFNEAKSQFVTFSSMTSNFPSSDTIQVGRCAVTSSHSAVYLGHNVFSNGYKMILIM